MTTLGKVLCKVAIGVGATTLAVYADYRIKGGPPIRKLYKTVKEERLRTEKENALCNTPIEGVGEVR